MRALARSAASSSRWRPQASCLQSLARIHGRHLTTEAASSWQTEGTGTEFGFVVEPNELESAEVLQQLQHLELNEGFWGRFRNIPQMAKATEKEEILQILENFVLIDRRHVVLCQRLKATVLRSLDDWTAPELAALCRSFAELGYLQEDLLIHMADRAIATLSICTSRDLCLLLDAYATTRTYVHSLVEAVTKQTLLRLDEFEASQLCLHASSYRRLNLCNEELMARLAARISEVPIPQDLVDGMQPSFSARDLTMLAHAFCKSRHRSQIFSLISRAAEPVMPNFTAKELQSLLVSMARAHHSDAALLDGISLQAQRCIAQFSAEALALTLRGMAFFGRRDDPLFTRALLELPRVLESARPADVAALCSSFAAAQVESRFLFDLVSPLVLEKAPALSATEWVLLLRSYATLEHRDEMFLSALELHLKVEQLSSCQQKEVNDMLSQLQRKV